MSQNTGPGTWVIICSYPLLPAQRLSCSIDSTSQVVFPPSKHCCQQPLPKLLQYLARFFTTWNGALTWTHHPYRCWNVLPKKNLWQFSPAPFVYDKNPSCSALFISPVSSLCFFTSHLKPPLTQECYQRIYASIFIL